MSGHPPGLQIIIDPTDDIATVRAVQALTSQREQVLVVPVTPMATSTVGIARDILRALGKRRDKGTPIVRHDVSLGAARRWLLAHGIDLVAVLYAQNIAKGVVGELTRELHESEIELSLIYTTAQPGVRPTHQLDDLLHKARKGDRQAATDTWPEVPAVHPLRLRYECRWTLSTEEFSHVDALLQDTYGRFGKWLSGHPRASKIELRRALSVVLACRDENQLRIRASAADLALISARRSIEPHTIDVDNLVRASLQGADAESVLRQLDPLSATRRAVDCMTSLPTDLLSLIGRDQISASRFLGAEPTAEIKPLLLALDLDGGWRHPGRPPTHVAGAPAMPQLSGKIESIQGVLHELLHTERKRLRRDLIHRAFRGEVNRMCAEDVLRIDENYCVATDVARYGMYQLYDAPIRRGLLHANR